MHVVRTRESSFVRYYTRPGNNSVGRYSTGRSAAKGITRVARRGSEGRPMSGRGAGLMLALPFRVVGDSGITLARMLMCSPLP
jgi:hypothetical protein